ncbi:MAG: DUF89 family protein [Clostridia bacterium]|nr:DUF89 family protein [Clostridia bacterium]
MKIYADCIACQLDRQLANVKHQTDETKKVDYIKEVCRIMSQFDSRYSSPVALSEINRAYVRYFGSPVSYEKEKREFDEFLLSFKDEIEEKLKISDDPLTLALKYASVGNYIDFGVYRNVQSSTLLALFDSVNDEQLDSLTLESFKRDLSCAESLVYLTDNCGESVLDALFIKTMKKLYPTLKIDIIVRGSAVLNDVTLQDAKRVGLDALAPITPNGTGIPGTQLDMINKESRRLIENADLIISKGQGNFETLQGCGLNIYYILLCKCDLFVKLFGLPKNSKIFANERTLIFPKQ